MTDWNDHYAQRAQRMQASEIRELLKLLDQPDIISFAGGIPDPKLFPVSAIAEATQRILGDEASAAAALQYSVSEGYLPLRQWLADYMAKLGVTCGPENIIITNGSQQGLDFIGKLFISPQDKVLVAWPTYLGALQAFSAYEPTYDLLPGLSPDRTVASYKAGAQRPKIGYVMPDFQNPTGTSLNRAERIALLDAADALNLPLIEDSAYEHLRYDGERPPTLMALAAERAGGVNNAKVLYCGTFSKSIVPSLRIGWIVAPEDVVHKLVLIKQASDLHVSTLTQMMMHEVITHLPASHGDIVRETYKTRRDALLASLAKHMPEGVSWTKPEGGMFVWMTLPGHIDGAELLARAINEIRVAFVPGSAFFPDRSGRNTLRLSFSLNEPAKIEEAMKRLGGLLRTY
ncbi:MAG TPA: PLP-dependent aminotransferase family protein [Candidatus Sulfotelmatobacter sp.]|jgi:DNA-binding transcriptional MocR family regulator|nr:PLP-dependent aminotransferase family protein [Candidatus Sulfotelmatobacter sp.]